MNPVGDTGGSAAGLPATAAVGDAARPSGSAVVCLDVVVQRKADLPAL